MSVYYMLKCAISLSTTVYIYVTAPTVKLNRFT